MRFRSLPTKNQKCSHKLIDSPFLTAHFKPLTYIGPHFLQAAHTLEQGADLPSSNLRGVVLGSQHLSPRCPCSLANLQHNLERMAKFLSFIEWRPNPPKSLGSVTVLHLTMCIFLFSSIEPQRKSLIILSTASHTLVGSAWHCM